MGEPRVHRSASSPTGAGSTLLSGVSGLRPRLAFSAHALSEVPRCQLAVGARVGWRNVGQFCGLSSCISRHACGRGSLCGRHCRAIRRTAADQSPRRHGGSGKVLHWTATDVFNLTTPRSRRNDLSAGGVTMASCAVRTDAGVFGNHHWSIAARFCQAPCAPLHPIEPPPLWLKLKDPSPEYLT
ncbi:hypothetical protein OKW42_004660 [Paraburkholderia sp. WC7.3d]